jgi:hypothetical protein
MKKIVTIIAFVLLGNLVNAQDLTGTWSDKEIYSKKLNGYYDDFEGSNSKYVYSTSRIGRKKIFIVSHDKSTMKETGSVALFDVKKEGDSKKYKGIRYYKTIVFENTIYVFWLIDSKLKDELFVESFDSKLKRLNPLKKIYELNSSKTDLRKAELFVMGNQKAGEKIIIGGELAANEGQDLKMEYKLLNSDFTFAAANQVALPVKALKGSVRSLFSTRGSDALSSSYEFGDDGNLHLKTYVSISKEEKQELKDKKKEATGEEKKALKQMATSYAIYSIVNVPSGKIYSYSMRADNKNILNFDFVVSKTAIKLIGFFNDVNKGGTLNGIFTASVDPKSYTITNLNFTYFTAEQLNTLFAKDKEEQKKLSEKASKKKKDAAESLRGNYEIENVQVLDKDNVVIVCSQMYNYSITTCNSKGQCTTRYYCQKDNVTLFKVNTKGDIVWASNLDRRKTYNFWNAYDVSVINKDKNFYITYGNDFNVLVGEGRDGKNKKKKKSKGQKNDRLEYAIVDYNTGTIQRKEFIVNAINAKKEDLKRVSVLDMNAIDDQFYTHYSKKKFGYMFTKQKAGFMGKISPVK